MTLGFIFYLLSIGMGVPLILFGMTGGKLLPKAGNWMNVVKVTFGFMMLAVAIVFIERLYNSCHWLYGDCWLRFIRLLRYRRANKLTDEACTCCCGGNRHYGKCWLTYQAG